MNPSVLVELRKLVEDDEEPAGKEREPAPASSAVDAAIEDEIRSATHAVLGASLGQKIYNSVFAGDLVNMVEKLATRHELKPGQVVDIVKETMSRWAYVSKMKLSDGSEVDVTCKLEVE